MKAKLHLEDLSRYRTELYGFSALWIMFFHAIAKCDLHYDTTLKWLDPLDYLISLGNSGVEIFFLLSGISLYFLFQKPQNPAAAALGAAGTASDAESLEGADSAHRPGTLSASTVGLGNFFTKRWIKLAVPSYLVYIPYWLYMWLFDEGTLRMLACRMSMMNFWMNGEQHIWFVSALIVFSLLYPFIYDYFFGEGVSWKRALLRLVIFAGVWIFFMYAFYIRYPNEYDKFEIALIRLPSFVVGCFLGKWVYEKKELPGYCIILAFVLCAAGLVVIRLWGLGGFWRRCSYLPLSIVTMLSLAQIFRWITWKPFHKFFTFLGGMSLELYLCHVVLIRWYMLLPAYENRTIPKYLLLLVLSVALAWVVKKVGNVIVRLILGKLFPSKRQPEKQTAA